MAVKTTTTETQTAVAVMGNSYDYETRLAAIKPEEKTKLLALTDKINPKDLASVQVYGSELNQVIANNANALLNSVRANSTDEVTELTNNLLSELKLIDIDEINPSHTWKRIARRTPIIRHFVKTVDNIMIKYDTIANNVDAISKKIGTAKVVALRDNSTLQQIFDNNVDYINQIRELIMGLKLKEQELITKLEEMRQDPTIEAYQLQDMQSFITSIQKRITNMQTTEYVLTQNLFQIRATQSNNTALAEKSDEIVNNVIPIWKNQLAISITMNNQKASIEATKKISETSNKILKQNAENLKMNSIAVAKANEEMIFALDTLQKTTQDLIETVNEVKRIHSDGEKQRHDVEKALKEYSEQLMTAVQNASNK